MSLSTWWCRLLIFQINTIWFNKILGWNFKGLQHWAVVNILEKSRSLILKIDLIQIINYLVWFFFYSLSLYRDFDILQYLNRRLWLILSHDSILFGIFRIKIKKFGSVCGNWFPTAHYRHSKFAINLFKDTTSMITPVFWYL